MEMYSAKMAQIEKEIAKLPEVDDNELIKKRDNEQNILDELVEKCGKAEEFAEIEKDFEKKLSELKINKEKFEQLSKRHESNWDALYGDAEKPLPPWTNCVSQISEEIRSRLNFVENQLKNAQLSAQESKTNVKHLMDEEQKLNAKILVLEEQIFEESACEPEEISKRLKEVRIQLKKARKKLEPINAKIVLYDSWIEEVNEKSCCPLCERKFPSKSETSSFSQKLHDVSISFPNEQENLEKLVLKSEEQEAKLAKADVLGCELKKMRVDLKDVENKLEIAKNKLEASEDIVKEKLEGQKELSKNMEYVTALQKDVGIMDSLFETIQHLEKELSKLKRSLTSRSDNESYAELKKKCVQQETVVRDFARQVDEIQKAANHKNSLRAELNKIREQRVSLGESSAQAAHISDTIKQKNIELSECEEDISRYRREYPIAKSKLEAVTMERTQINDELRQEETKMMTEMNELKRKHQTMMQLNERLEMLTTTANELTLKRDYLRNINQQIEDFNNRKIQLELKVSNIDGSQSKLRTLQDQLTRLLIEKKMTELEDELDTLRRLGANRQTLKEATHSLRKINQDLDLIGKEFTRISAVLGENDLRLTESSKKLMTLDIVNAENNYRNVVLEQKIIEETIKDLEKYRKCFDDSLLKFHQEKMTAINEIIDELWRRVYNSTDIETIRIRSNTNESSAKNRAYDYTVLMVQEGGKEIDMRGRCSAGQKMLASLIIRIALAEVFGGLCSMIALDEPTTNLDDGKVEGMADVLVELIEARQAVDENGQIRGRQMQVRI
ncbi:unnamed protein product [Caenorhabditis bovis]|uniref:Zinc-hook domain-containing protein n=1 Tax=Caenorhabditis bovis TaxID=2654633 RepID=A0A8S1E737_9PELO|nr:unnamed protein product [Caenorhabditis bovis]